MSITKCVNGRACSFQGDCSEADKKAEWTEVRKNLVLDIEIKGIPTNYEYFGQIYIQNQAGVTLYSTDLYTPEYEYKNGSN